MREPLIFIFRRVNYLRIFLLRKVHNFYNRILFGIQGISYPKKGNLNGPLILKNRGVIKIGEGITINSHTRYNPVGINHQTVFATLNKKAKIIFGQNCGISGASIVSASEVQIGNFVLIGGGVGIWDTDFHPVDPEIRREHPTKEAKTKPIVIEDDVFVGARAIILKGVHIGKAAVIAAGAVVNKDVPPHHLAYGNPVQIIPLNKGQN